MYDGFLTDMIVFSSSSSESMSEERMDSDSFSHSELYCCMSSSGLFAGGNFMTMGSLTYAILGDCSLTSLMVPITFRDLGVVRAFWDINSYYKLNSIINHL